MKAAIIVLFLLLNSYLSAQVLDSLKFRFNAGLGYTIIDLDNSLDWANYSLEDWSQINVKANLQAYIFHLGPVYVGAEIGYNYLYYYEVKVPYVPTPLTYWGNVGPFNIGVLSYVEFFGFFSILAGAGIYIFDDGVTAGLKGALVFSIPLNKNFRIPICVESEVIFGQGTPVTVGISSGLEFTLNLKKK